MVKQLSRSKTVDVKVDEQLTWDEHIEYLIKHYQV